MKRLMLGILILLLLVSQGYCASQWDKVNPSGTIAGADIDYYVATINNEALDRLNYDHRQNAKISYASASTITVGIGTLSLPNAGGTIVRWRRNTANTTLTWADLDTGSEAISTTYYIFGIADTDATTFTCKISTSSSAPSTVPATTYYRKLGSFYNDASGNITNIINDDYFGYTFYDSGWFAIATGTAYTKTHNLGTMKCIVAVYVSNSADGSGVVLQGQGALTDQAIGCSITDLSATDVVLQTAPTYIASYYVGATPTLLSSGYARVIILAVE